MLTAKQPKGCDAKLQGLPRRQAEWQPVATLRRSALCWWINFYEKERDVCALCNSSILFSDIDPRNLPGSNPKNKKKVKYKTMKKKPLLFALLALAIVTSLTAGTLAVYTKSVNLGTTVDVKKFAFTAAGGTESDNKAIKLAPKESMTYQFAVSNTDNGVTSEVDLTYVISIDMADAATQMPGLTATLSGGGMTEKIITPLEGDNKGKLTYSTTLPQTTSKTDNYVVTVAWNAGTNDQHNTAGTTVVGTKGLNVNVTATQKI